MCFEPWPTNLMNFLECGVTTYHANGSHFISGRKIQDQCAQLEGLLYVNEFREFSYLGVEVFRWLSDDNSNSSSAHSVHYRGRSFRII